MIHSFKKYEHNGRSIEIAQSLDGTQYMYRIVTGLQFQDGYRCTVFESMELAANAAEWEADNGFAKVMLL